MFKKPTGFVPSAVQLLRFPLEGVPRTGVTKVGDVDNTLLPEPVEVVTPVPPDKTGRAEASVTPAAATVNLVTPAACKANSPEASPVTIAPPVEVSALIVVVMCYPSALIFAVRACTCASSSSLVGAVTVGSTTTGAVNTPSA